MADGITLRNSLEVLLLKIESTEAVDASPAGSADAIPFEAGSFSWGDPFTEENSNEATGSLVAGAPLIVGQAVPISFRFRLKGAGAGTAYSGSVTPPHHAVFRAAGWKGVFTAAVTTAVATAGTTTTATLGTGFGTTAQMYRGMPFNVSAGPNAAELPIATDYTAAKLATFADLMPTAFTTSSSLALIANWTYANTSPADASARATDQPSATLYRYLDGKLLKFLGLRGQIAIDGASAKPGFATFTGTAIYAGETDAAVPATPNLATNAAPLVLQGAALTEAFLINRRALPISQFNFTSNGTVESPADPNTASGFGAAQIGGRTPRFTCDPLQTLVATRDTLADIAAGSVYPGVIRGGYTSGNRWALTMPRMQPVKRTDAQRGLLASEALELRVLNTALQDSNTRDGDAILTFY
jgi:hypothetical protein